MKNFIVTILFIFSFNANSLNAQTIVDAHGQLHIEGTKVLDECDREVQLKGMSFFWHQWDHTTDYWNNDVISWLRDDWKVQIIRGAVAVRGGDCCDYLGDPEGTTEAVHRLIQACVDEGMYVIVDWHSHYIQTAKAKEFFANISREFGEYPNVIYEIFNEPWGNSYTDYIKWPEIKAYAKELIATIRENDPDNIIICGTPFFDQFIHEAAADPITVDAMNNQVQNIAYTVHVYAGTHKSTQRNWAQQGLNKGLCLFMTEFDRTEAKFDTMDAAIDMASWNAWEKWANDNKITWTNWSLGIKEELNSALYPSASTHPTKENGGWDYNTDLRPSGQWKRDYLRSVNTIPVGCGPCPLNVSSKEIQFSYLPDTVQIIVTTPLDFDVVKIPTWMDYSIDNTNAHIEFYISENTSDEVRIDTIFVRGNCKNENEADPERQLLIIQNPFIHVEGVVFEESNFTMALNDRSSVTATILPTNADNKELSWKILDESIATVDESGMVLALQLGSTKIVATSLDNGSSDTTMLTVVNCNFAVNRALFKPTTTSSTEQDFVGSNAVDGDPKTRWSSLYSDPNSITIDLEGAHYIDKVILSWEAAYAKSYSIQVSDDAENWNDIYYTFYSNGNIDELENIAGYGRYVRVLGLTRGTSYGYSLYEVEIYGCSILENTYINLSTSLINVGADKIQEVFSVHSNEVCVIESKYDWITIENNSVSNGTVSFQIDENTKTKSREGKITVTSGNVSKPILVLQEGNSKTRSTTLIEGNLNIYPNPATDKLIVESKGCQRLELMNSEGQLVLKLPLQSLQQSIDISHLSSGMYFIKTFVDYEVTVRKVLIVQ